MFYGIVNFPEQKAVCMNKVIKKEWFALDNVKRAVNYWCDDTRSGRYTGSGIRVAVLDTGIILHPDFDRRIVGFKDFVSGKRKIYDDSGHGTHVAGILGGSGKVSGGSYAGMAPKAGIVMARVLDRAGNGKVESVLEGIEWILKLSKKQNIRIVNISAGTHPGLKKEEEKRLLLGVEQLWDAGLVVVVSAGNYGPEKGSVAVPGSSRKVITVGMADLPGCWNGRQTYQKYSGRGPTDECVIKPDLTAPGTQIVSCNGEYTNRWKSPYTKKSGTSMAAPVVSGAIACLLSKYPDMTNIEVKLRLRESCTAFQEEKEGWGILDMEQLMTGRF